MCVRCLFGLFSLMPFGPTTDNHQFCAIRRCLRCIRIKCVHCSRIIMCGFQCDRLLIHSHLVNNYAIKLHIIHSIGWLTESRRLTKSKFEWNDTNFGLNTRHFKQTAMWTEWKFTKFSSSSFSTRRCSRDQRLKETARNSWTAIKPWEKWFLKKSILKEYHDELKTKQFRTGSVHFFSVSQ